MKGSILIVEDDSDIAELIDAYVKREGFDTRITETGEAALAAFSQAEWDLILLDINLPGADGFEVLRRVRERSAVPVIIITARTEEMDAVFGLGAGADEYVTKPFSPRVLVARVRALLRRLEAVAEEEADETVVTFGEVEVDLDTARVFRGGKEVSLPPKEFAVLTYLIERAGRPASPAEIYEAVWENEYGEVSSVAVHVQRLRRKLEPEPAHPRYITTRHGYGYVLERAGRGPEYGGGPGWAGEHGKGPEQGEQ